jgi:hypothetical protein
MNESILTLTPKRKSILWSYQNDGNAKAIVLKREEQKQINEFYSDEGSSLDISKSDTTSIDFNVTGTKIWEQCDGINTVDEILNNLSQEFKVEKNDLMEDLSEFLKYCDSVNIIDVNWMSLK